MRSLSIGVLHACNEFALLRAASLCHGCCCCYTTLSCCNSMLQVRPAFLRHIRSDISLQHVVHSCWGVSQLPGVTRAPGRAMPCNGPIRISACNHYLQVCLQGSLQGHTLQRPQGISVSTHTLKVCVLCLYLVVAHQS